MRERIPRFPPGSGAFVMGTGIVSVALAVDGAETLSRALLAVAAAGWVALAATGIVHRYDVSFTAVAGTAVLGARAALLGWGRAAAAMLVVALTLWVVRAARSLSTVPRRAAGAAFLVVVATEALAVLAAFVAADDHAAWLAAAALAPFALGLAAYLHVVARFDLHELVDGRGDQWVAGGALAIATLACAKLAAVGEATAVLKPAALVLWSSASAWLPFLVAGELRRPFRGYDVRRWATVFPVGMYAVCSFLVASVDHVAAIGSLARAWTWLAVAVWGATLTAAVARTVGVYDP
ncbi:MAG TPA: hypothetical protein VI408_12545 [Gaiellaceae bacterium]